MACVRLPETNHGWNLKEECKIPNFQILLYYHQFQAPKNHQTHLTTVELRSRLVCGHQHRQNVFYSTQLVSRSFLHPNVPDNDRFATKIKSVGLETLTCFIIAPTIRTTVDAGLLPVLIQIPFKPDKRISSLDNP